MEEVLASGLGWPIFNFAVFVVVLFFVLRRPVREFWVSRSHELRFEIEEADRLRREVEGRYEGVKRRWGQMEREVTTLIQSLEQEGMLEKERLVAEAKRRAERILEDGEKIAAQEIRKARETLKAQAVDLAVGEALRAVRENLTDRDQKRLTGEYLTALEGGAAP